MGDAVTGSDGAAAAATAAATAAAAAVKPWFDGKVDADTTTWMTNRGWHSKPAVDVAVEAMKAHRELEKHIGVPANELIRIPKTPTAPEWKDVYTKLGAPADPAAYKFDGLKLNDADLPPALQDFFRKTATDLHLSVEGASRMASAVITQLKTDVDAATATRTAELANQKTELAKNWGANAEVNKVVASNAAKAFGITPEVINALEATMGYAKTMEFFRQVGTKIGEDSFVRGSTQVGGTSIMTVDQAVEKRSALMKDQAWVNRYLAGGHEEKKEMTALNTIVTAAAGR